MTSQREQVIEVTLCKDTGEKAAPDGRCYIHGGDACLAEYFHYSQLDTLRAEGEAKTKEGLQLTVTIDGLEAENARLKADLAAQRAKHMQDVADMTRELDRREDQLAAREREVASKTLTMVALARQVTELQEQAEAREREVAQAKEDLHDWSSRSALAAARRALDAARAILQLVFLYGSGPSDVSGAAEWQRAQSLYQSLLATLGGAEGKG